VARRAILRAVRPRDHAAALERRQPFVVDAQLCEHFGRVLSE
jgi:hypothetical protein